MFIKKSIVLCDIDGKSNKKAVLTLEKNESDVAGTVRLYNFPTELEGILTLGFHVDKRVIKSGLTRKANGLYTFFLTDDFLSKNFSCAVVQFKQAQAVPILYGSSEGRDEDIYGSIIAEISQDSSLKNVTNVLDKHKVEYADEEKQEIEKEIDNCLSGNCSECIYKKYFFENHQTKTEVQDMIEKTPEKEEVEEKQEKEVSFVDRLKPQIDKLFEKNPIENNLQAMIPDSKWIKVEYEDDGDFYVFGLLYEHDEIKYVCYGVPAVFEEEPPKELAGYPVFLPLNSNDKKGFGYWLTYQDAQTGEPVKAVLE